MTLTKWFFVAYFAIVIAVLVHSSVGLFRTRRLLAKLRREQIEAERRAKDFQTERLWRAETSHIKGPITAAHVDEARQSMAAAHGYSSITRRHYGYTSGYISVDLMPGIEWGSDDD